ncbi:type II toxin-antitoxin system ParD family antitoxin [Mycolicibacterium poriferae]
MSRARLRQALIAGDRSGETTPFGRDGFASQGRLCRILRWLARA